MGKNDKKSAHERLFQIGGLTIQVQSDLPITDATFPKINPFQISYPDQEIITVQHHFFLPQINRSLLGKMMYHCPPWAVYSGQDEWTYLGIAPDPEDQSVFQLGVANVDHSGVKIYYPTDELFRMGGLHSLSFLTTDQILLAQVLANRQGSLLHSAGMVIEGQGFLFVGHSGAGKSTIVTMLREHGVILCDDRNIIRRWTDGWRVYGTWSHGDVPDVSPISAPLRAIFLLEQANENRAILIEDRREIVRKLPFFVVKPLVTADWWEKTLDLLGVVAREVPVYRLLFDRSGRVIDVIRQLL